MQTVTEQMLSSTPNRTTLGGEALAACLDACGACEIACRSCSDACLGEPKLDQLRQCIRLNLDCAALCHATVDVGSRTFGIDASLLKSVIELCARVCESCAAECDKHKHHEHCKVCADVCRRCAQACRAALGS